MRLCCLLLVVACAAQPVHVRDPDGRPLPTTARLDADMPPVEVKCNGRSYLITEPSPPYLTGTNLATHQIVVTDAAALCAKIRAYE